MKVSHTVHNLKMVNISTLVETIQYTTHAFRMLRSNFLVFIKLSNETISLRRIFPIQVT